MTESDYNPIEDYADEHGILALLQAVSEVLKGDANDIGQTVEFPEETERQEQLAETIDRYIAQANGE